MKYRKVISLITSFSLLFQSFLPLAFAMPVYAEGDTATDSVVVEPTATPEIMPEVTSEVTPEVTVTPEITPEATPEVTPEVTVTPEITPEATPEVTPEVTVTPEITSEVTPEPVPTPEVSPEITPTPTPSPWTFENVEQDKEYVSPQNSEVKLTFTKLPTPAGNIKIEEITLTPEQIQQTGSLSDKAYDITSDMADGTFAYNLSLPIPESSKGKSVGVKFSEDLSKIDSAEKVDNAVTKTDTSVSVASLDHFTIFVVVMPSEVTGDLCVSASPNCYTTIQSAIDAAALDLSVGPHTINVAAGTYNEALTITTANLSIIGDGEGSVTINVAGKSGGSLQSGISVTSSGVTLQGFTLTSDGAYPSSPRYGIKFSGTTGGTLQNVTITGLYRSGVDMPSVSGMTIDHVTAQNNGGNGLGLRDISDSIISNITTSGNTWGGVRIQTYNGTISGVVVSGTNDFQETAASGVGGLYLEQSNVSVLGPPYSIIYGTSGSPNVLVQSADFSYAVHGNDEEAPQYSRIWLYKTLDDAKTAAALASGQPSHITDNRYIESLVDDNWYVPSNLGSIQAAIDAASSGDTVNVAAGTYSERIDITKPLNLIGAGVGNSTIDATSFFTTGNVIDITGLTGNIKVEGFDIKTGNLSNGIHSSDGTDASGKIEILNNHIISNNYLDAGDYQFGIIAGYGDIRKLIIYGNQISNTYNNSILIERQLGETEITNNTLEGAFPSIFFMTYSGDDITTLQKVNKNTIDMVSADQTWYGSAITFNSARRNVSSVSLGSGKYTNISIEENIIKNLSTTSLYNYKGIHLVNDDPAGTGGDITNAVINNNQISGATGNNSIGIKLSGKITGTVLTNNIIKDLSVGLLGVSNNNGAGTQYPSTTTFSDKNSLSGNTVGINWPSSSPSLDATENYWGSSNPTVVQAGISGSVIFRPYYTDSGKSILSPTVPGTPTTTSTSPTTNTNPTWSWSPSIDADHYIFYWSTILGGTDFDSGNINGTSYTHTNPLTNDIWYSKVLAHDPNGNTSPFSGNSDPLTVDTTAPTGTIIINDGATITNSHTVTLAISASADLSGVTQMNIANTSSYHGWEDFATSKTWTLSEDDGNKTVRVKFKDAAGNETETGIPAYITVDTTIPVITRNGDASITLEIKTPYTDAGATATDIVGGNLTSSIVTVNPVNVNTAGTYTITYNVKDVANNSATEVTRTVIIQDSIEEAFNKISSDLAGSPSYVANNLKDVTTGNIQTFSGLYFEKSISGVKKGKITFNSALDLSDNETKIFLQNLGTKLDASTTGLIGLDFRGATSSNDLLGVNATIEFYGLDALGFTADSTSDEVNSKLIAYDDDGNLIDKSELIDDPGVYTPPVGACEVGGACYIFSVDVAHFTKYKIDDVTQTTPNIDGDATLSGDTTEVVLTDPNQDVTVDIASGTVDPTIDVSAFVSLVDGEQTGTLPEITITSSAADVVISDGTVVTGPADWDGIIQAPISGTPSGGNAPAGFSVGSTVISVGSPDGTLTFDTAVTIVLPGVTGTVGYRPSGSDTWYTITTCGGSYDTPTLPTAPGECAINNGTDTKIVTYHFTSFGSLTTNSSGGGGSNGGSGVSDGLSGNTPVCNEAKPGSAPVLLSAVAGVNSVTLNWSAASTPVTYYLVTYGTGAGLQQYGNPNVGGAGTTSYTISGLSGGNTYYFRVRAGNGCMPGDYSNELSATVGGGFIAGPATGFEEGVLGASTDATPTVTPTLTPSVTETTPNILGSSDEKNNNDWLWLLLFIPLYFGLRRIFKKK